QVSATFVYNSLGFAEVRFIIERRDRGRLCNAVHVEGLSCLVKHFRHFTRRNGIADAEPSKPVNLGESTKHNDISSVANKSECVGGIIQEFEIRLIKKHNNHV